MDGKVYIAINVVQGVLQLAVVGLPHLSEWIKGSPQRESLKRRKIQHKRKMDELFALEAKEKTMSEKLPRGDGSHNYVHIDHKNILERFEAFYSVVTEIVKHYGLIKNNLSQDSGSSLSIIFSERGKLIDKLKELDEEFKTKIGEFRKSFTPISSETFGSTFLVFRKLASIMEEEFISCSIQGLLDKPDLVCGAALKHVDLYQEHIAETGSKVEDIFYEGFQRLYSSRQRDTIEDLDNRKSDEKSEEN